MPRISRHLGNSLLLPSHAVKMLSVRSCQLGNPMPQSSDTQAQG